jgi:serine/threonine protein kinase
VTGVADHQRDRVSDLYHAALRRTPAERSAYLKEACAGNEALQQEVESLLRYEPGSRFLERPVAALADMANAPGAVVRQFGPFEILAPIGAGGMGEVYRARDTKLGREVAIKILSPQFTADSGRRARFAREARLLATLNHQNIGAIYGLEETDGLAALELELVEGPTLADRLDRGSMPVPEALAIARQIAEALDAAHEKGIVHRDLKPANIVLQGTSGVTSGGLRAKVLDFGLAKATSLQGDSTQREAGSVDGTAEGTILGTPAYMSPEQARGLPLDKRTDIWAFGCILFQMLSGQRPFGGDCVADTIAFILEREPDWGALPPGTPEPVRRLLYRCLTKDPAKRMRDIGDAAPDLGESRPADPSVRLIGPRTSRRPALWLSIAATAGLIVTVVSAARLMRPISVVSPADRPVMQLDVDLGPDVSLPSGPGPAVAISPNGQRLVFVSNGRLMTRRLDQPVSVALGRTEGVSSFFLSPDSESVAFVSDGKLKRLAMDGRSVVTICDAPAELRGGSWGDGDTIIFAGLFGGLMRVKVGVGHAEPLTQLDADELTHRWPQLLPGGKAVLFTSHTAPTWWSRARIDVLSLVDGRRTRLQERASFGRFISDSDGRGGYLTFVRGGALFAAPFDPISLKLLGPPFPVLERVAYDNAGAAQVEASNTGAIVTRPQSRVGLAWVDSSGPTRLLAEPGDYDAPALSRDGNRVAYSLGEDIWVYDVVRDVRTQVTKGLAVTRPKIWTSDDQFIVFSTPDGIYWARSDGGSEPRPLLPVRPPHVRIASSISGGGSSHLAFYEQTPGSGTFWDLWTAPIIIDATGMRTEEPKPFLRTKDDERDLQFSPDGRWVAYFSGEVLGRHEVYVRAFPDDGRRWKVSDRGGWAPKWSPERPGLFFLASGLVMVAPYSARDANFAPEKPRVWSRQPVAVEPSPNPYPYSVSADGKRVVALIPDVPSEQHSRRHVTLWVNALAEFRRRMPAER